MLEKGGSGVLRHYSSVEAALRDIYPDLDWDSSMFLNRCPPGYWNDAHNIRKALDLAESQLGITKVP